MKTNFKISLQNCLLTITVILALTACKKDSDIIAPDFNVTTSATTYAVGAPITFNFTGDADIISFYSGEPDSEFKYKDRFSVNGKPQMQFTSYYQASTQANTLQLLVSKDFNGTYNAENVQAATWTDITSQATLSTGTDNTPSGVIDLSSFQESNVPIYIAFKYTATKASAQPTWTIKNISISNKQTDGTLIPIADLTSLSWGSVSVLNSSKLWTYSTSQIQFLTSPAGTDDNEDWLITQPLQLDRVQRALGLSIKNSPTTKQSSFVFSGYAAPGTYTATFEATNANRWDKKTVIRELTIVVQ